MVPPQCFGCFSKYFIGVANIILLIVGILAAIAVGKDVEGWNLIKSGSTLTALIVIAFICIFASAIAGICILFIKNKKIYWIYFGMVVITLIFEFIALFYTIFVSVNAVDEVKEEWYSSYYLYRILLESAHNCCGIDIWNTTDCGYNVTKVTVPSNMTCGIYISKGVNYVFMVIEYWIVAIIIFQLATTVLATYMAFVYHPDFEKFPPLSQ